jgi:hypothetical protein
VGDYEEPGTAEADASVRELMAGGASIRYSFAHFPVNQTCNPEMTFTRYQNSCTASRLVEAAGALGGNEAFWAAHAWAFAKRTTPANLTAANLAQTIGAECECNDRGRREGGEGAGHYGVACGVH